MEMHINKIITKLLSILVRVHLIRKKDSLRIESKRTVVKWPQDTPLYTGDASTQCPSVIPEGMSLTPGEVKHPDAKALREKALLLLEVDQDKELHQ